MFIENYIIGCVSKMVINYIPKLQWRDGVLIIEWNIK